jgi:hypothetical protein
MAKTWLRYGAEIAGFWRGDPGEHPCRAFRGSSLDGVATEGVQRVVRVVL